MSTYIVDGVVMTMKFRFRFDRSDNHCVNTITGLFKIIVYYNKNIQNTGK